MSSDAFQFLTTDYPDKVHRLLKMDHDGNFRVYSFNEKMKTWKVTWQAKPEPCEVHGLCGENSMCSYDPVIGRTCFCLKGYKVKNPQDWTEGCVPEFKPADLSCNRGVSFGFLRLQNTELFGYDLNKTAVTSLKQCQDLCLGLCEKCKGVQFRFNEESTYDCYPKTLLVNGRDSHNLDELKTATKGFTKEIGRGGGGTVYKGILDDDRVAAVKCLNEAHQGEAEFLAEISTIGMLNHMNLIDMWGYCVEGKHRILVKNAPTSMFWIEEIVDGNLEGKFDVNQVENLVKVALKCVKDDMNERPSMSQVVEMLLESNERRGTPR
ncbi:hypothetical protein TSUD_316640 [Trifolium subterraneum]|uniref:non-specific serine/threonine protein kinase n=1 Tax=Trifolium subterraneum TaxID=3900 RepID=A0A2Z6MVF6_TRISU|nr:hypothetical protein TSUD_316640 [Trifolium subterraneum]